MDWLSSRSEIRLSEFFLKERVNSAHRCWLTGVDLAVGSRLQPKRLRLWRLTQLDVEVRSTIPHAVTVQKAQQWLQRAVISRRGVASKERLRALL